MFAQDTIDKRDCVRSMISSKQCVRPGLYRYLFNWVIGSGSRHAKMVWASWILIR
jgi:hypothetical protein